MHYGDATLNAASDSVHPLTSCGYGKSRLMANWLKDQKVDTEHVLASPFLQAEQTLNVVEECMNLPAGADALPELTPCDDVGPVSVYLQVLANEGIATALVISHLPLVGYLVSELCLGETPPMFTASAIASVMLDESGKGTLNRQMNPCNLKIARAIQTGRIKHSSHPEDQKAVSAALFVLLHHGSSDGSHSSISVNISNVASPPCSFGA